MWGEGKNQHNLHNVSGLKGKVISIEEGSEVMEEGFLRQAVVFLWLHLVAS